MRRPRRLWGRPPEPSPLERATNVGVTLPSFNFIEPKVPRRPVATAGTPTVLPSIPTSKRNKFPTDASEKSVVNYDAIVYHTLLRWANEFDDPTLNEESKVARLWQSLQRHSEAGRFSEFTDYVPNPICSSVAIEIVQQILQASGVSLMLTNLLIGAIGNSIFRGYKSEIVHHELKQFADIANELNKKCCSLTEELATCKTQAATQRTQLVAYQLDGRSSTTEDKAQLVSAVYRSVEEQGLVPTLIMETLTPFFNDELLLLLWNAMAKESAAQGLATELKPANSNDDPPTNSITTHRKRASFMATRVLQERVRLMLILWQTLSAEERTTLSKCLTDADEEKRSGSHGFALKGVLQALEEIYVSEQVRDRSSSRRSMFLSPTARHSSVVVWQPSGQGIGSTSPSFRQDGMVFTRTSTRRRLMSTRNTLAPISGQPTQTILTAPHISIPDVLLGALAESQHEAATEESQLVIEQLCNDQDEILRQCEEIFDLLCEDPTERGVMKPALEPSGGNSSGYAIVDLAKERMCDLLCNYVDAPSFILEKFEKSEAEREVRESVTRDLEGPNNTHAVVQMLIQRQRQDPTVLVNAINQSPEILLSAITNNNGILRFAIINFVPLVKRFLRLDLKACEYLDFLAQKNKGIQLLWGTNTQSHGSPVATTPTLANSSSLRLSSSPKAASSVSDVLEELVARRRSSAMDVGTNRGPVLSPVELHLLEWFAAHTGDLALLALKRPDILKPLLVEMHTISDVSTFHRAMLQLTTTKGLQNFIQRASVSALEKIAQEDPAEVSRLLREIFNDSANQDLLDQLRSSPYLTTCLCEFHPTAIQDVISSDMETWRHYFVETVAANDSILRESLVTRTENLVGGETLIKLFNAVLTSSTVGLNLQALDFDASPDDVAMAKTRDGLSRRKRAQCIYLRGGSSVFRTVIAQLITSVGFHPHEKCVSASTRSSQLPVASHSIHAAESRSSTSSAGHAPSRAKAKKSHHGLSGAPIKKRHHSITKHEDTPTALEVPSMGQDNIDITIPSPPMESMPSIWRSFVRHYLRQQQQMTSEFRAPTLTLAHTKMLILDLWIEFLKVDTVHVDNTSLWTLAPFVCDYLVTRYDSPSVVGAWLYALTEALITLHDDPRVAFFASSCGFHSSTATGDGDGYDTFLYYAHALGHVLFGHMKVFKTECRLEETADGSCPVEKQFVIASAARLFDHRLLSGSEIDELMTRLELLPAIDAQGRVELDDAMTVFLDQWRLANTHVDERYRQAFISHDTAKSNRIGLEQFIKIVTSVMQQSISPRECLLVFCDFGYELLDLETLLHITRVYHLRLFNTNLPEIELDESEQQELAQSVGRTNIFSMAREIEDLNRFWKGLRLEVQTQIDALHQSKHTKMLLKKQSALIEKLLHEIQANPQPPSSHPPPGSNSGTTNRPRSRQLDRVTAGNTGPQLLHKAWTELRICAKMLQSAKLTQHYLSRLYIQTCVVRWVHLMRKRQLARERREAAENEMLDQVVAGANVAVVEQED